MTAGSIGNGLLLSLDLQGGSPRGQVASLGLSYDRKPRLLVQQVLDGLLMVTMQPWQAHTLCHACRLTRHLAPTVSSWDSRRLLRPAMSLNVLPASLLIGTILLTAGACPRKVAVTLSPCAHVSNSTVCPHPFLAPLHLEP